MKCPRCEREMQKGYFRNANQSVQWIPETSKPSIWKSGVAKGAIELGDCSFSRGYWVDAHYCPACRFVIVPVE